MLLTCDHVQSNVEDEVKSEMENTGMDNTGKSCSKLSLMSAFNRSAFSESCSYSEQSCVFIPQQYHQKMDEILMIRLILTLIEKSLYL